MVQDVRADLGKPVDPWFDKLPPGLKRIANPLREIILSAVPSLKGEMKWGMPFFMRNGMVCGLMKAKTHLSLFFPKGSKLKDPKKILQGEGKTVRSLKFTKRGDIPAAAVKAFVKQAASFNA